MKLIYIGNGAALIGVPPRDLQESDIEALKYDVVTLLKSGLYKNPDVTKQDVITPRPKKQKKERE